MKVIVFKGQSQYDVLSTYSLYFTQKLQKYGIDAINCDMNIVDGEMYLKLVESFKPNFTMGFNPVGYSYENSLSHFNKTNVPHIVRLGDNPYYHMFDRILNNPNDQLVHTLTTQTSFEYSFKELGINRYSFTRFTPAEKHYEVSFKSKIYPTVFFGTYVDPNRILQSLENNGISGWLAEVIRKFCLMIYDHVTQVKTLLNEPIEVYFTSYLKEEYQMESGKIRELTRKVFYFIDHYYRNLIRSVVLTTFAEEQIEMLVFGREDTARLLEPYSNVKVLAPVYYSEYINILAHSKVAVNITPMFKSDHERITTTLFNSTLLCTNLMEDLIKNYPKILDSCLLYDLNNLKETAQVIKEILSNEEEYNEIVQTGYKLASENFTFENDIEEILSIYRKEF